MDRFGWRLRDEEIDEGWLGWKPPHDERPLFLIGWPWNKQQVIAGNGPMVAFEAYSREVVDDCYGLAISAGGAIEGAPGLRSHYHPHYYGAYARDPYGNKLCFVCHAPSQDKD